MAGAANSDVMPGNCLTVSSHNAFLMVEMYHSNSKLTDRDMKSLAARSLFGTPDRPMVRESTLTVNPRVIIIEIFVS